MNRMIARVLALVADALKLIAAGGYAQAAGSLRQAANQLDELDAARGWATTPTSGRRCASHE